MSRMKRSKRILSSSDEDDKTPPPCNDPEIFDPEASEPESEELSEDEYEVEKILSHDYRTAERKYYYYVRWKGWSKEHDSWVSEDDMGCPEVIKAYKAQQKAKHRNILADDDDVGDFIEDDGGEAPYQKGSGGDSQDKHLKRKRRKQQEQQLKREARSPSPSTSAAHTTQEKTFVATTALVADAVQRQSLPPPVVLSTTNRNDADNAGPESSPLAVEGVELDLATLLGEKEKEGGGGINNSKVNTMGAEETPKHESSNKQLQPHTETDMDTLQQQSGEKARKRGEMHRRTTTADEPQRQREGTAEGSDEDDGGGGEEMPAEQQQQQQREDTEEYESSSSSNNNEEQQPQQKRQHFDVKRGPVPKKGKRGYATSSSSSHRNAARGGADAAGSKGFKCAVSKEVWHDYLGIKWMGDIDSIEMEEEDEPQYEPMMPLNPDKPEEVDCWVKELMDIEDNGINRGWEVESVIGVGEKAADGSRQCFVKFVGFKSPQQIPMTFVQEKAPEAFFQWCSWQNGMDNLDKCGAYWQQTLRQPPAWMCRRSLVAFAAWKAKMCKREGQQEERFADDDDGQQQKQKQKLWKWQWAPQSEDDDDVYEEEDEEDGDDDEFGEEEDDGTTEEHNDDDQDTESAEEEEAEQGQQHQHMGPDDDGANEAADEEEDG